MSKKSESTVVPIRLDAEMIKKLNELDKHYNGLSSNRSVVIRHALEELYKNTFSK